MTRRMVVARVWVVLIALAVTGGGVSAQSGAVAGTVRDEAGGPLAGVAVELVRGHSPASSTETNAAGSYRFEGVPAGAARVAFMLVNFANTTRDVTVPSIGDVRADAVMHLSLSADVTVTARSTFVNLADVDDPTRSLVGIAQAASQGAITARQLDARPLMRTAEVLETVPGVVISQHSGEGKANQYYLRGFNLDHGTDFATTVAGMPVNMPTHGHGHGYSDLNFLIPELVSGIQFSKGPYFADQGDFATAGAATITYANGLSRPLARISGGEGGFGRALAAASHGVGRNTVLAGVEVQGNDGPWLHPDEYRKVNGMIRFSRGDALNGFAVTGMGYRGTWNSTDQVPARAVAAGALDRFGAVDQTDGGDSSRYSGSFEWQYTRQNVSTKVSAYGIGYDLSLFSNFTYFLEDPVDGDQFQQTDHRLTTGARVSQRRLGRLAGRPTQNTVGMQLRNDAITNGLHATVARRRLATIRQDDVLQTSLAGHAQNETQWTPWMRTLAGIRADVYRFGVGASHPENSGTEVAALVSPKGGVTLGPWNGTEFYVNGGFGFHSNDARGATITVGPSSGAHVDRVTPLARARGAEVGVRTVRVPHLQSSVALWTLSLASELIFVGDAGTTEAGRPSHRFGVEWSNYYSPRPWLTFDGDVSVSRARFTDDDPAGHLVPGAVATVLSGGATITGLHRVFGSVRLRCFGPRALAEDGSIWSRATTMVNMDVGYAIRPGLRLSVDAFNLLDAADSDVDYFYRSRLPGEPGEGVDDVHFHPVIPRTVRVSLMVGF